MKTIYLRFLLSFLFILTSITAFAYDCEINGIYYNLDKTTKTASVMSRISYFDISSNSMVSIPDKITYDRITYSVTSIGNEAFEYYSKLTSITIPNSVTSIGDDAFSGCSGLTAVNITDLASWCNISFGNYNSNPLYYAHHLYLNGEEVKDLVIPNSVTSISRYAFDGCSGLTSITIPSSVTSIGDDAFSGCSGLTAVNITDLASWCNISFGYHGNPLYYAHHLYLNGEEVKDLVIPNSVTSISRYAFDGCSGLTSVNIPNSVTSISCNAFKGCSGLTSVNIPNSVTSISDYAFYGCSELTAVHITDLASWCNISFYYSESNPLSYAHHLYLNGEEVKDLVIPNSVRSIGRSAFSGCSGLTSVTIPSSVTSISDYAFSGCSGLTSVTIPSSVISIGGSAFYGCSGLTAVTIPNSVTSIGEGAFYGCSGLTSITIPNSVTSIDDYAFSGCSGLTDITIPNSVTSIGSEAFRGCSNIPFFTVPDNVKNVGSNAFGEATIYTKPGNVSLLTLWKAGYDVYDVSTKNLIEKPSLEEFTDITQTTAVINVKNKYKEYTYCYNIGTINYNKEGQKYIEWHSNDNTIKGEKTKLTGLKPEWTQVVNMKISLGEVSYALDETTFETASLAPTLDANTTASSITMNCSYTKGDAKVQNPRIVLVLYEDTIPLTGSSHKVLGLRPNFTYGCEYLIDVPYGDGETETYSSDIKYVKTKELVLNMQQPKVISAGNVIVAANTNIDEDEPYFGFEWRRTDWTNEFGSQYGKGILYEEQMEGYIRNLNTEKLWKVRPYYYRESEDIHHYGDWVGIDPSNTSYFEPTVHTYAKISVESNGALVKGYAMRGTDKVKVQGFKYWKTVAGANLRETAQRRAAAVPGDAMTEEVAISGAGQQMMSANLKGLDYNSTYHFVAFVTTEENETFYGEEQSFTTGDDPTGIESIEADGKANEPVREVARYNLNGQRITAPQKGVNIIRYSNGQTKKVFIK